MGVEQYSAGQIDQVTNASAIWIGDGTDWKNEISLSAPCTIKINLDGESVYSIATIISATRLHTSANYQGTTGSGLGYMVMRSYTSRGYWRILQGDADFAEILSQETIDPIDEDISHIMSGNATVDGTTSTSFGIDTDGNCARLKVANLTASREIELPNKAANLVVMDTDFNASPSLSASIVGNASVAGQCNGFKKFYTVMGTPFAVPYWDV